MYGFTRGDKTTYLSNNLIIFVKNSRCDNYNVKICCGYKITTTNRFCDLKNIGSEYHQFIHDARILSSKFSDGHKWVWSLHQLVYFGFIEPFLCLLAIDREINNIGT